MSANCIFLLFPGILYIVFAFKKPPKALDQMLRVPGLFSLFPEENRDKHGRILVGSVLIVVAVAGFASAVYDALPHGTGPTAGYLRDASSVAAPFKAKIGGPVRVVELDVFPDHVAAQIQDPKKRGNVDAYELRDGAVGDGEPVKFVGSSPTPKDLDEAVVDLAAVNLAALPRMVKDATAQLKIDDGKATHVVLKRNRPFNNDASFRVFVSGARKEGSVEYDAASKLKKVWN
jgi:hypothetical protein